MSATFAVPCKDKTRAPLAQLNQGKTMPSDMEQHTSQVERAVDTRAMAEIIGSSASTLGRMAKKGLVPSHFVGEAMSARRFYPSRVRAALDQLSAGRIAMSKRRVRKMTRNDEA
jgi:hypothetical protein